MRVDIQSSILLTSENMRTEQARWIRIDTTIEIERMTVSDTEVYAATFKLMTRSEQRSTYTLL